MDRTITMLSCREILRCERKGDNVGKITVNLTMERSAMLWMVGRAPFWVVRQICRQLGDYGPPTLHDGKLEYRMRGELHRNGDLPAVIGANGHQEWWKDGKRHREGDLPAIITADGNQEWWKKWKTTPRW